MQSYLNFKIDLPSVLKAGSFGKKNIKKVFVTDSKYADKNHFENVIEIILKSFILIYLS